MAILEHIQCNAVLLLFRRIDHGNITDTLLSRTLFINMSGQRGTHDLCGITTKALLHLISSYLIMPSECILCGEVQ